MKIHGFQKMTLLDYPGRVACTVFLGGCDMLCPFCHNAELLDGTAPSVMGEEELIGFLEKDGDCWTAWRSQEENPFCRKTCLDWQQESGSLVIP